MLKQIKNLVENKGVNRIRVIIPRTGSDFKGRVFQVDDNALVLDIKGADGSEKFAVFSKQVLAEAQVTVVEDRIGRDRRLTSMAKKTKPVTPETVAKDTKETK